MKKTILLIAFFALLFNCSGFAQKTNLDEQTELMMKSNRLKRTGNILAVGGGTLLVGGLIAAAVDDPIMTFWNEPEKTKTSEIGMVCLITGAGLLVASIPFYVSAQDQKKKALQVSVGKIGVQQIGKGSFVNQNIPALKFTLNL